MLRSAIDHIPCVRGHVFGYGVVHVFCLNFSFVCRRFLEDLASVSHGMSVDLMCSRDTVLCNCTPELAKPEPALHRSYMQVCHCYTQMVSPCMHMYRIR